MSIIQLQNLTKYYEPYQILNSISLSIERGDRIGLIGQNGCGKTTLIELIAGQITEFLGTVHRAKKIRVGYLSQEVNLEPSLTLRQTMLNIFSDLNNLENQILQLYEDLETQPECDLLLEKLAKLEAKHESLGGYDYEHRIDFTLTGLSFHKSEFNQKIGTLSGGEKSRACLAKLLLEDPDLLLLDEPTNHLDINAIQWLENFLRNSYDGAVLAVSHDRYFLDRFATKIIRLHNAEIKSYRGNYSTFTKTFEIDQLSQKRALKKQQAFIEKEEDFIRRNIAGQRTREAQGRRKRLDRLERIEKPEIENQSIKLNFTPSIRGGNDILKCRNVEKTFGDKKVIRDLNLDLYRGEVLGIIGPNGVGKTTFFKMILGEITPTNGEISVGQNLQIGYYDQLLRDLNRSNTVFDEIAEMRPSWTIGETRDFLGRFLFSEDEVFKMIGDLSGGEQGRLMFAKLLLQQPNLLLLDEPTNHLDIPSADAIETAIRSFSATCLIISHDRFFINKVATKLLIFADGKLPKLFHGTFAEYERSIEEAKTSEIVEISQKSKTPSKNSQNKKSKTDQNSTRRERVFVASKSRKSKKRKNR